MKLSLPVSMYVKPQTAIYIRLSQNRDDDLRKPERQRQPCENLLRSRGDDSPTEEYLDDDKSAYKGKKKRPAWLRLRADIEAGRVNQVVALHMDRALRDNKELEALIDLADKHPFRLVTVQSGTLDLTEAAGRANARVAVTFAAQESERKAERHRDKAAQLRAAGMSQGGARPFGWESPNGALKSDEASLIYRATRDLLKAPDERTTLYRIRQEWNASGLSTATHRVDDRDHRIDGGGMWPNNKAVARILMRFRNAGLMEHQGEVVGPAVWSAISVDGELPITEEDVRLVRALLSNPERRTTPGPTRKHLLSGIATCGKCGHVLRKAQGGRKTAYYRCSNQPRCYLSIQQEALDNLLNLAIRSRFTHDDPARFASSSADRERLMRLRGELVVIETDSTQVAEAVGRGDVSYRSQQAMLKGFQERRYEIERTLSILTSRIATAEMLMVVMPGQDVLDRGVAVKRRWEALSLDKRRSIVSELYESIVVSPGRGGVLERVQLKRRVRPC